MYKQQMVYVSFFKVKLTSELLMNNSIILIHKEFFAKFFHCIVKNAILFVLQSVVT